MHIIVLLLFLTFTMSSSMAADRVLIGNDLDSFLRDVNTQIEKMDQCDKHYAPLKKAYDNAQAIQQKIDQAKNKEATAHNKKVIEDLTRQLKNETEKIQKILDDIKKYQMPVQIESLSSDSLLTEKGEIGTVPSHPGKRMSELRKPSEPEYEQD